jgi:selenide,water dikinase
MTDVTGFGLAGHLSRMCQASGVGAELQTEAIQTYPGAITAVENGIRSSLYPANRATLPDFTTASPKAELLFDPQTCGGLLAAISATEAEALCNKIEGAHIIGHITDGGGITTR